MGLHGHGQRLLRQWVEGTTELQGRTRQVKFPLLIGAPTQITLHHVPNESDASKVDAYLRRDSEGSAGKPSREDRRVHYKAPRHGQIRVGHGRPQVT